MAIDTANKRSSATGFMVPFPSGTVDTGDRLHVVGLYRGIAADEPVEDVGINVRTVQKVIINIG